MLTRIHRRAPRALRQGSASRANRWGTAALVLVLFLLGAASVRSRGSSSFATLLPYAPSDSARYSVVVVAQRADCQGNLGHLAFLERPSIRAQISTRYLLLEGTPQDTMSLRLRLPQALRTSSFGLLTAGQRQLLHGLGHDATPILALYDPLGRLVLMSATPDDVVARTALVRALTRILRTDPSP